MKIGIQTWGTEGDIRPFIALAGELQASGHEVTLAVSCVKRMDFTDFEKRLGFRLLDIALPEFETDYRTDLMQQIFKTRNVLKHIKIVLDNFLDPFAADLLIGAKQLCRENELIIRHLLAYPAQIAAEHANLPCVSVCPTLTSVPTTRYMPFGPTSFGRFINSILWKLAEGILNHSFGKAIVMMRQQEGLPPIKSILRECWFSKYLTLIAVSPTLFHSQPDWESHFQVCGFLNVPEQEESMVVPNDLDKFLDAGSPPVFMTFGSVMEADPSPAETTRMMVDAARIARCRAIIQSSEDMVNGLPESPDICWIGRIAHQHVFPRCAAVVHAGGAGTTQAAIRAGCPSIIVAHANDQSTWGKVLKHAGIAPKTLFRRSVTAEKLARSIQIVLKSPNMASKARELSHKMQKENGRKRAVELIEASLSRLQTST